jgi:electron transport complex protein RnfG
MKHVKIVVTLTVVVLIASILVFFVEGWTTPIIDDYNFEQANIAKYEVLPSLASNDSLESDSSYDFTGTSITELIVVPGKGYIYTAEFQGFQSIVTYMIGIDTNGTITGYKTLIQGDTPGLGAEIVKDWYKDQFPGTSTNDLSGIDGWTGATITFGGSAASLSKVMDFHNSTFEGVVLETPAEKLARWKTEITIEDGTFTDVSGDYDLSNGLTKVELVNDGSTDVAVIYTVEFAGYVAENVDPDELVEYIIAFDLATNDVIGLRVVYNGESAGIGSIISDESFQTQFESMLQMDALDGNIDEVAGGSAPVTYGAFRDSLNKVVTFHKVEFEGVVIVIPDPVETTDANLLLAFLGAATFTSVYADYTYVEDILNIYEVKDGTDALIGYVYYGHAKGFGVDNIEFAWGVDVYGVTVDIAILNDTQSWDDANEYADYDGSAGLDFNTSSWLNSLEGVTLESLINTTIDAVAGVSTTTGAMIEVTKTIAQYHLDEFEIMVSPDFATTSDANLLLAVPGAVTFTSVYENFTYNENILNVYEAKDATDTVIGYVYFGHADGFGANDIEFVLGVDASNNTVEIAILNDTESWDAAEGSEYADYDGSAGLDFNTTTWLENFEGVTLQSLLTTQVDGVAGVSTSTGAMIDVIEVIAQYHTDESVGGGS